MTQKHGVTVCIKSHKQCVEGSQLDPQTSYPKARVLAFILMPHPNPEKKYPFSHLLCSRSCEQISLENSFHSGPLSALAYFLKVLTGN